MKKVIVTCLIISSTVFAQDVKAPEIKLEDKLAIVTLQKQLSDLRVQYNQLFQQWLQSEQVTEITAQSIQVNSQINQAVQNAIKNAKLDTDKWNLNTTTLVVEPAPKKEAAK